VIEPTDLDICVAHRGFGVFVLRTRGVAAHGGASDDGVDANLHMARLLCGLDQVRAAWQSRYAHPLLPPPDLHVPLVSGGRQLFMYSDACEAHLECRTVPGQSAADVRRDLGAVIEALRGSFDGFQASLEPGLWRSPWETEADRPIVRTLLAAATAVRGGPPRLIGHPWWEDSGLFGEAGIDVAVIGPAGAGIHAHEEWVDTESVLELAEILLAAVLTCGGGGRHDEGATIG
jgi:acetylornithine deacetylase